MENNTLTPDKQEAIDAFEKKQKRMFQIGRATIWIIAGWDIFSVVITTLAVLFEFLAIVPGFIAAAQGSIFILIVGALMVAMDIALIRGFTWVRIVRALLAAIDVIGTIGTFILEFPQNTWSNAVSAAIAIAVCYMLFFSKSVKEYTYAVNRQF